MGVIGRSIWVTGQFIALHRWVDCPLPEVSFLKNWHRHVFKVKMTLKVDHSFRDLEFFTVQNQLLDILKGYDHLRHNMSCEMWAEDVYTKMGEYKDFITSIDVSEDGENGAIISFSQ